MATFVNEVTVHAIAIMTLTTLAVLFRGPIKNASKTILVMARGLTRNVSGEWYATLDTEGGPYEQTIRLRQFADFIWGTIECATTGRTFYVTGRVVHHTVIARYELTGGSAITIDNGTFSLWLNDDGDTMQGRLACSVGRASHSLTSEYVWRRTTPVASSMTEQNSVTTETALTSLTPARETEFANAS